MTDEEIEELFRLINAPNLDKEQEGAIRVFLDSLEDDEHEFVEKVVHNSKARFFKQRWT